MKDIAQLQRTFTLAKPDDAAGDDFALLVQRTAKLIGKSFVVTFKMVEKWEPGFAAALYDDCLTKWKNRGFNSPSHMWWTERKKLSGKTTTT